MLAALTCPHPATPQAVKLSRRVAPVDRELWPRASLALCPSRQERVSTIKLLLSSPNLVGGAGKAEGLLEKCEWPSRQLRLPTGEAKNCKDFLPLSECITHCPEMCLARQLVRETGVRLTAKPPILCHGLPLSSLRETVSIPSLYFEYSLLEKESRHLSSRGIRTVLSRYMPCTITIPSRYLPPIILNFRF